MKRRQREVKGRRQSHQQPEVSISTMGFHPRQFTCEEATAKFPDSLTCIERMLKGRKHTDTTVSVGSETFQCHMIVLKCYSEYFENLDVVANAPDIKTVILPEDQVSPVAFFKIYDWMLKDDEQIPRLNFAEIYKAAKFLRIKAMMNQLMCIIDDKTLIGEREALSIYLESKKVGEKSLQEIMMKKISKIFLTFVASLEYLQLDYEEVEGFFRSNRLGVNSELDMLFAAIRWLQHEWPQRKKSIPNLLKLVRFELLQSWQLIEMKKYPKELQHIFKGQEVQEMIEKAVAYISLQYVENGGGDAAIPPKIFNRLIINDPFWNEFKFEMNVNVYDNYRNFCSYLSQLDGQMWRKLKYADPKHETVIL